MSKHTPGTWKYRPSQSRQVVSDTGETICKIHRGKKAQFNGPIVAAAPDLLQAVEDLLMAASPLHTDPYETSNAVRKAFAAVSKAKGDKV